MLVTVERTVSSARPIPELLTWCQTPQSRAQWPGVERIRWDDTNVLPRLHYDVHITAPGAPEAVASVEEHMCRPEEDDDGIFFESAQLWNWPTPHVAGCWATYHFSEAEGRTTFRFTFRYLLPDLGGTDVFRRARFGQSIERAVDLYVTGIVAAGGSSSAVG
ncbi:MAG TPA: hypothetical protein VGP90_14765 [Acidimicrobiia bacterium]|jgi:hypothetical protein|nr:hypothetical protein [Acidimicrobiia bacterium]